MPRVRLWIAIICLIVALGILLYDQLAAPPVAEFGIEEDAVCPVDCGSFSEVEQ